MKLNKIIFALINFLICFSCDCFTCAGCSGSEKEYNSDERQEKYFQGIDSLDIESSDCEKSPRKIGLHNCSVIHLPRPNSFDEFFVCEEYGQKLFILIIEDQELIWYIFLNIFKSIRKDFKRFCFLFSPMGEDGVKLHAACRPCMTFIDYHLAGKMNGKEVVETLKEKYGEALKQNLGYLVAFSNDIEMNAGMGADFQIPKMTNIEQFRKALELGLSQQ